MISHWGISYSRGRDKTDNAPVQQVAATFDAFEAEILRDRSPEKGLTFICAPLMSAKHYQKPDKYQGDNHWRLKNLVVPRAFLPFDFDGFDSPETFEAVKLLFACFRGFGYTTASHRPEAPRARVILQASRPVSREECILVCNTLQAQLEDQLGIHAIKLDGTVYRGEQPVYTPLINSEAFHFSGDPVDVDSYLLVASRRGPTAPSLQPSQNSIIGADVFHIPITINDGEGRENFVLRYAGHLRSKGLGQAEIERTLLDYNQLHIVPPLDTDKVLDKCRRYEKLVIGEDTHKQWTGDAYKVMQEPQELFDSLPSVPKFPIKLLPKQIAAYVQDVADRMSCPVEFPAVAAMVALASAIGSRIYCKPYANGSWLVPAGAWGMVVSPPSAIKSPPLSELLRPLYALDKKAADDYDKALKQYAIDKAVYDHAVKSAVKAGSNNPGVACPDEPHMTRYVVNDSTYEKLVEIAKANPNGFLVWRDELIGWFHSLAKENQKEARGLYLTGWSGTEGYATDRIGRGHVRADRVSLSLLGTIQPNVLRQVVHDAVSGGASDDGLIARFQLAVYPDPVTKFVKVDRAPNMVAMQHYENLIKKLISLDPASAGAHVEIDGTAYLPFDEDAQTIFDDWRQRLEDRIRNSESEEHPSILSHLGKYRSLFPKLALVLHLSAGHTGPIGRSAAERARAWIVLLEAHARRMYHTATNRVMQSAVVLSNKIKAGQLRDGFTRSDVLLKEWASLRTAEEVTMALTVLRDMGWITIVEDRQTGGRPAERWYIHPKFKRAS
jgi:putative DNA primase/helicase